MVELFPYARFSVLLSLAGLECEVNKEDFFAVLFYFILYYIEKKEKCSWDMQDEFQNCNEH